MSFSTILIAFWLYAGRSLLLCMNSACRSKHDKAWSFSTSLALGLLIPPGVLAVFSWWDFAFHGTLVVLVCLDLLLLYKFVRSAYDDLLAIRGTAIILFVFSLIVFTLSYFNGPFIEHLADSWWHMKNVSWMINNNTLLLPSAIHGEVGTINSYIYYLGIDYASYRLQALLTWMTNCSVLESWIATSMVASTILGLSIFLLFYSLRLDNLTLALSLLFWLVLFSGMNTGLRLGGWPAGMGYVFLNLGLASTYLLYRDLNSRKGWILFFTSAVGAAMFHLAELFLLAIAISALLTTKFLFRYSSLVRSSLVLAVFCTLLLAYFLLFPSATLATFYAAFGSALVLFAGWSIGVLYFRTNRITFLVTTSLLICVVSYLVIDWEHLLGLFNPAAESTTDYYSDYIPHYKASWNGKFLIISKWAHQLRASVLWSSVASVFLVIWLVWTNNRCRTQWLLILTVIPWLVLVSPSIFTLLSALVPGYGVYRVQYLMPTAAVLGVSTVYAMRHLLTRSASGSELINGSTFGKPGWLKSLLSVNTLTILLLFGVTYVLYQTTLKALSNFQSISPSPWFDSGLLTACALFCLFRISAKKVLSLLFLSMCVLLFVSDLTVRLGFSGERPWAVKTNSQFHWFLRDNRETLRLHSSWRYQKDLENLRHLTSGDLNAGFFSDLATSYYTAAETGLRPMVQQAHHSKSGLRHNNTMRAFCSGNMSGYEFRERINLINARREKRGGSLIRYIIINRDKANYTAEVLGTFCVGEVDHLKIELSRIAELKYKGDYLSLWEITEQ